MAEDSLKDKTGKREGWIAIDDMVGHLENKD